MSYLEYIQLVIAEILKGTCFICTSNHYTYLTTGRMHPGHMLMLQREVDNRLCGYTFITHPLILTTKNHLSSDEHRAYRVFILNSIAGDYAKKHNLPYKPKFD